MDASEDLDVKLQKIYSHAIVDAKARLLRLLRNKSTRPNPRLSNPRLRDYENIVKQINTLQEEPQLLDSHLQEILPLLTNAFIHSAPARSPASEPPGELTLFSAVSTILYTLCKVRGEKIISRFFNNEPKYIELLLGTLQMSAKNVAVESADLATLKVGQDSNAREDVQIHWEERYIAMLWLSHLMLTPFDLASVSTEAAVQDIPQGLDLPAGLPSLCRQLIALSIEAIVSPSKERDAAAKLVVTMCLRPDMRPHQLLECMMAWSLSNISASSTPVFDAYRPIGILSFMNGLISRADRNIIVPFFPRVQEKIQSIRNKDSIDFSNFGSSAVAKKLLIKLQRNIMVKILQSNKNESTEAAAVTSMMLDEMGILEEVIESLLSSMGDRDTKVRYAVAKALSIVSLNLQPEMAAEIVDAVLAGLNEDIVVVKGYTDLTAVNPLQWHALTLTLAHFLFRKTPTPSQLPQVLQALFLALKFEQRSITGTPLGSNVRDAANFGIWSLARRYSTSDLLAVGPSSAQGASTTTIQWIANELATAACLDPVGNVRRGSSAALQELVGRHSDTISNGITLIQIIDYSAVALRRRALTEVCLSTAKLDEGYRNILLEGLLDWRGILAPDRVSRNIAAQAIGLLTELMSFAEAMKLIEQLKDLMASSQHTDAEVRHGISMSLASIISSQYTVDESCKFEAETISSQSAQIDKLNKLSSLWSVFGTSLQLSSKDFSSATSHPELSAEIVIALCSTLAQCSLKLRDTYNEDQSEFNNNVALPTDKTIARFNISLGCADAHTLEVLPEACGRLCRLLTLDNSVKFIETLTEELKSSKDIPRVQGIMIALASAWNTWHKHRELKTEDIRKAIFEQLIMKSQSNRVEIRVVAIRSLGAILSDLHSPDKHSAVEEDIFNALNIALQDYEITARGDAGSLVRIEALEVIWRLGPIERIEESDAAHQCMLSVHRLALERMDKIRLRAARCLMLHKIIPDRILNNLADVSSYDYFSDLSLLLYQIPGRDSEAQFSLTIQLLEGFSSSAGAGADTILQAARSALACILENLPIEATEGQSLMNIGGAILKLLSVNISNERVIVPLLELIAFCCDAGLFKRLEGNGFKWRTLLYLVQKSHYKSNNLARLRSAIEVYRGLSEIDILRQDVVTKLIGMLSHPLHRARIAAAETLYMITKDNTLKSVDWSQAPVALKWTIQEIRMRHVPLN